jgi:cystathionine gamma-synthase
VLPDLGIAVTPVDLTDLAAVRAAIRPETRLIHAETPCNPILRLTDLAALSALARSAGVLVSVDSTLATPVVTRPLDHGVDLVIHSLTKFMNGHGDALGGAVIGRKDLMSRIRSRAGVYLGASLSAQNAWLILRGPGHAVPADAHGLRHGGRAGRLAGGASRRGAGGLAGGRQPSATGAGPGADGAGRRDDRVSGAERRGGAGRAMAERFRILHYAFSLGHQRSICVQIGTDEIQRSTFRMQGAALDRWRDWAGEGVFRLSVGLEDPADLIADLYRALTP